MLGLIGNYATTMLRNMARHKLHTGFTIAGLAVGLAAAILIGLYVRFELSYDAWVPGADRVYRAETQLNLPGNEPIVSPQTSPRIAQALRSRFPEVEAQALISREQVTLELPERSEGATVLFAEPAFMDIFPFAMRAGPVQALSGPQDMAISAQAALRLFGTTDILGQPISLNGEAHRITAVFETLRPDSHFDFDYLVHLDSAASNDQTDAENWVSLSHLLYLRTTEGVDGAALERRLETFLKEEGAESQFPEAFRARLTQPLIDMTLVPLRDLHFRAQGSFPGQAMKAAGDKGLLAGAAAIAGIILLMAAANFTNLGAARSLQRGREAALRRVVGAARRDLLLQFLGESVLTALVALVLGVVLAELLGGWVMARLDRALPLALLRDPVTLAGLAVLGLAVGVLAGLYPALLAARMAPAGVIRQNKSGAGPAVLRFAIVVLQFGVSITLVAVVAVVFGQIRHIAQFDRGFDPQNVVLISGLEPDRSAVALAPLRDALAAVPGVQAVGVAAGVFGPGGALVRSTFIEEEEATGEQVRRSRDLTLRFADPGLFRALAITPLAGRLFDADRDGAGDGRSVILTETAMRNFGFKTPQEAVGQRILVPINISQTGSSNSQEPPADSEVVGVVPDLYLEGARSGPQPTVLLFWTARPSALVVRLDPARQGEALAAIDEVWEELAPDTPLNRSFLIDHLAAADADVRRDLHVVAAGAALAVLIACLGLYGLAAYAAERRGREVGVRRVFGAETRDLVRLLLWQFSKPVLLANLLAWPAAYLFLRDWLDGFVHRITLTPWPFLAAGLGALLIAWATVAGHAWRLASIRPARVFRTN